MTQHISRRQFIKALGAAGALGPLALAEQGAQAAAKPNIVVILSDDQGYVDSGCYGGKDVRTPNIDRLAAEGVRLTDGYVSCPVCSPTRAGIMTGRYQQRFGYYTNQASNVAGLPLEEITLAQVLRSAGYATGAIGKWHLGTQPDRHPMSRGFDEFYGFLGGAHSYIKLRREDIPANPIMRGREAIDEQGYLTDLFTREALSFIERHKREPFFLYLAYNAVHGPLEATEKYLSRVKADDPKRRTYLAMLAALDDGVGAVLDKLEEVGVSENTLVFFLTDNGGPTPKTTANNGPLRGTKGTVWEGGIRVPFIVRWPARLPAGKTCSEPVISLDIFPTCLAAAGVPLPRGRTYDGKNLIPTLAGRSSGPLHEALFWAFRWSPNGGFWAIRRGEWKLVHDAGTLHLFNLAEDIGEQRDLAQDKPQLVKELSEQYYEWRKQMADPITPPAELKQRLGGKKRRGRGKGK